MTTDQPNQITFPWQLLSNEAIAVAADLGRLDDRIRTLRYEADQLERGLRPVIAQRLANLTDANERYLQQTRATKPDCDACGDTGRVPWVAGFNDVDAMDDDGKVPCLDCKP